MILVVRREGDGIRRYCHVASGNYNPQTARLYTDFGLFTCDPEIGADLTDLFNALTGFAVPAGYPEAAGGPDGMRHPVARTDPPGSGPRPGRPAGPHPAKINALVDPEIITALYEASRAGVEMDLLVRGICCLRPGLPGISERIRVVSIIGRFLEHSRAFYFLNDGEEEVYISSADWMPAQSRPPHRGGRPGQAPEHRQALRRLLDLMWGDNRQAWDLHSDGSYVQRHAPSPEEEWATHRQMVEMYRGGATSS